MQASIAHTANVREAISSMAVHGVASLRVLNATGQMMGHLHAADLLAPTDHE
jgi:purine nucleoside phosphorylase